MDAYGQLHGHSLAIVTGKPVELGGSLGREAATGLGVFYPFLEAAKTMGLAVEGARVVIQGMGKVGSWTARFLREQGCKIVGLSEIDGGVYNPRGLDVNARLSRNGSGGPLAAYSAGDAVTNQELLELDCDVLIPAALGNVITADNASRIRARLVLEGANHPTTLQADHILRDRRVTVLPDILVNAGGVIVSYFEWTQNLQQFRWEEDLVNQELRKILRKAYHEVRSKVEARGYTYREGAFEIGVERVARAVELRGFV